MLKFCLLAQRKTLTLQQKLLHHYHQLIGQKIWRNLLPLMHYSPDHLFNVLLPHLERLTAHKPIQEIDHIDLAFLTGDHQIIQAVLQATHTPVNWATLYQAILSNNANAVMYCHIHGQPMLLMHLDDAAMHGCDEVTKLAVNQLKLAPDHHTLYYAGISNHLPTIKFLVEQCHLEPTLSTLEAAQHGRANSSNDNASLYISARLKLRPVPPLAGPITPGA